MRTLRLLRAMGGTVQDCLGKNRASSFLLTVYEHPIFQDGVPLVFLTLTTENGEEMHIEEELINAGLAIVDCGIHELKLDLEGEIDSPVRGK